MGVAKHHHILRCCRPRSCHPIMQIVSKLEAAGFEVSSLSSENGVGCPENPFLENAESFSSFGAAENYLTRLKRLTHAQEAIAEEERTRAHLNNCEQCREGAANGTPAIPGATSQHKP